MPHCARLSRGMNRMASEIQSVAAECIRIRGARMHNLQNIDLDIPRDRFVVITGPSGSGKSSLAFDTLYAEGQRQYIESLSTYARQFLHQLERPDVDLIEGLQPTISIDQRAGSHNPRSTVATVTEIYDYLRLLFARLGEARCYQCGEPIRQQTPEQILDALLELSAGTRVMILAPLVRGRKGEHKDVLESIRKLGFLRARVDGQVIDVNSPPALVAQKSHNIEAVIDRVVVREGVRDTDRRVDQPGGAARRWAGAGHARGEDGRRQRLARPAVQHAIRLSQLQNQLRGIGAAHLQLQQSLRGVSQVRGSWVAGGVRSGVGFARRRVCRWPPARLRRGRAKRPAPCENTKTICGRFLDEGRHPLEHAAGKTHAEAPRPIVARRRASGSSACWECWRRNTPPPSARRSGSGSRRSAARWCAKSAAARGCGPKHVASAWPAGRSTKSRR